MNRYMPILLSLLILFSALAGWVGGNDDEEIDIDEILLELDGDNDGILNVADLCPETEEIYRSFVNQNGCYDENDVLDSDNDGVVNSRDLCQNTGFGEQVFLNGCSIAELDVDGDGVIDIRDECPNSNSSLPTLPNGCNQEEEVSGVAERIFSQQILNYKITNPIEPVLFGFASNEKFVINIGSYTTDNDSQFVIGTMYQNSFLSPENNDLMIHYSGISFIQNIVDYIETLEQRETGGYGGLYFRNLTGDEPLQDGLQHYIWAIPKNSTSDFFNPPTDFNYLGPNLCDQPPIEKVPFSLPNGEIDDLSLYDFTGKIVVLEIGAEWCGPCKDLIADMKELNLYEMYNEKIQFLSMSYETIDRDPMTIQAARERQIDEDINFPVAGQNEIAQYYLENIGGSVPILIIFSVNPDRGLNLVTIASTVGPGAMNNIDTIDEVNRLFSGEYADNLCKDEINTLDPFANNEDYDGDGVPNYLDVFPEDPTESLDFDGDGIGDNSDDDRDGDGTLDTNDLCPNTDMSWYSELFSVLHEDGCADMDGDRIISTVDCDDNDPVIGEDFDRDGFCGNDDLFPDDNTEWADTDGDGVGDNSDWAPYNEWESKDSDGDGIGDNGDWCDNVSVNVALDGCTDNDGDGISINYTVVGLYFIDEETGEIIPWDEGSVNIIDCDDNNASIPGQEIIDGIDNDCDGEVDEINPLTILPEINYVTITTDNPHNNSDLTCEFDYVDEGNNVDLFIGGWYVNGLTAGLGNNGYGYWEYSSSIQLESEWFQKGDYVVCFFQLYYDTDNESNLDLWGYERITIGNAIPEISNLEIIEGADSLSCSFDSLDQDGDLLTFTYNWYLDGVLVSNNSTLSFSEISDGIISCTVIASDGEDNVQASAEDYTYAEN